MTFLSVTPDALYADAPWAASRPRARALRAPFAAHMAAALVFAAALAVPGAVAQAKLGKLGLVVTFVGHRCAAAFSA